jgi:OmpA-OmpF porin, OOP family
MVTITQASRDDDNDDATALAAREADERHDGLVIGGGVLVAVVVVLGVLAQMFGWLNGAEVDWNRTLRPVFSAMVDDPKAQGAVPTRIAVAGTVAQETTKTDLLAMVSSSFPGVPVDSSKLRVLPKTKPEQAGVQVRIDDKFGNTKRFALSWQRGKFSYDGSFYDQALLSAAMKTHAELPKEMQGDFRCTLAERPAIDPKILSATLAEKLRGKVIEFDVGKDTLTAAGAAVVDALAPDLATLTGLRVIVEGHTDADGDAVMNRSLSLARSQAVVRALAAKGADAKRFDARGLGGDRPIAPNDTPENKQLNRRVEMYAREVD